MGVRSNTKTQEAHLEFFGLNESTTAQDKKAADK